MLHHLAREAQIPAVERLQAGELGQIAGHRAHRLALAQAGLAQTLAPLGTAVTEDQLRLLWRLVPTPTFALDGDRAGRAAALRAVDRALPLLKPGLSLKFAWLPEGEDPDSLIKRRGLGALTPILQAATPLSEVVWQSHFDPRPATPEARAGAWQALVRDVERLSDATVRATFTAEYEARFEGDYGVRQLALPATERQEFRPWKKIPAYYRREDLRWSGDLRQPPNSLGLEHMLMTLLVDRPETTIAAIGDPGQVRLSDAKTNELFQLFFVSAVRLASLDKTTVHSHVREAGLGATLAQFDSNTMRTKAGICGTELSEQEFSTKVMDIWGKLAAPATRARPRLR